MRVPLSWLRDFAPFEGAPAELATTLSDLGLVVEGIDTVGEGLQHVVVGRVVETRPHPGADRVQLVDVDAGEGPVQVVCGAFNFAVGDLVPFATVGADLPNGMSIQRRKVRGEWSNGMLCSGAELELSDDGSGILVLPAGLTPGQEVGDALGVASDVVFDIDVTPNRPDALAIAGVARDLAARLRVPFEIPEPPDLGAETGRNPRGSAPRSGVSGPSTVSLSVESPDLCPRFTGTLFEGVTVGPSPAALAGRLTLAGMRPISNVVDVSNYVMLELGHPNHPYDHDRLPGGGILVRRGCEGETLVTLDGEVRSVGPEDCLICDAEGTPVGVGGVMGGASSEIGEGTGRVLLEVAYFSPEAIARTSKRLGLRTEASVRFERGVDAHGIDRAVRRFGQLLSDVAGATSGEGTNDVRGELPERPRVVVRTSRVNAILGTDMPAGAVAGYLEPIGFEVRPLEGAGDFDVVVPSWRPDTEREIDVIEEVGRHHGYGAIERTLPAITKAGGLTPYQRERRRIREVMVGAGLSEAWTNSLVSPDDLRRAGLPVEAVEVENPLDQNESVLRTSLLPGLLKALVTNHSHQNPDVALFEIGHVFIPPEVDGVERPREPENLAAALAGRDAAAAKRLWDTLVEDLKLDAVTVERDSPRGLHPTRSARLSVGDGVVGEIDPDVLAAFGLPGPVAWLEVDLGAVLAAPRRPRRYRPVSRFPAAEIDLAFVVPEAVGADAVERVLREADDLVEQVGLFDVFRGGQLGDGRRSLAFRVRFSALDHTLSEEELGGLRTRLITAVETQLGATIRS